MHTPFLTCPSELNGSVALAGIGPCGTIYGGGYSGPVGPSLVVKRAYQVHNSRTSRELLPRLSIFMKEMLEDTA
jgi:hypothetical protein